MKTVGKFEVELKPLESFLEGQGGMNTARMSIEKTFRGELEATSRGEMLSVQAPVEGAAAYAALEQVTGAIGQRTGSFMLAHLGTMDETAHRQVVDIVSGSGTGGFVGMTGKLSIDNDEDGQHHYTLEWELA